MKSKLITLLALSWTMLASAQTANTFITQGTNDLNQQTQQGLWNANTNFAYAVALSPTNETANVLWAATRLLTLPQTPAGSNFLNTLNITNGIRSVFGWTAKLPKDTNGYDIFPANYNSTNIVAFFRTNIMTAISASATNLAVVTDTNYILVLSSAETGTESVTLDYGDIQMLRALLSAAQFMGYTLNANNCSVVMPQMGNMFETHTFSFQWMLTNYPNLLTMQNTADLASSKSALTNAIGYYFAASSFIRNTRPTGATTNLFVLSTNDYPEEAEFRTDLTNILLSLNAPTEFNTNKLDSTIYAGSYFSGTNSLRGLMPRFNGDAYVNNTLPSYTFGGILPYEPAFMTEAMLRKRFYSYAGIYAGQIYDFNYNDESSAGNFAVFVSTNQQATIVGYDIYSFQHYNGQAGGVAAHFNLDWDRNWWNVNSNSVDGVYGYSSGSIGKDGSFNGYLYFTNGDSVELNGFQPSQQSPVGPFQNAAGNYSGTWSGTFNGQAQSGTVNAVLSASGQTTFCLFNHGTENDGGVSQFDSNNQFTTTETASGSTVSGTLNNSTLIITGISSNSFGSATWTISRSGNVPFDVPPVITTNLPSNIGGLVGTNVTLLLVATGSPPMCYQWYLNGNAIPFATTNTLIVSNLQYSSAGTYSVSVNNAVGGTNAAVSLGIPPSVALQPTNTSVAATVGNNVTLAVSVAGTGPFTYQWQLNGTNLPNGIITTVAGNGTNGYSGDGGAATNAELYPGSVAVDANGNLFFADNENIRKVGANGIITTVAGNGYYHPNYGYGHGGYSGDGGVATNAELNDPWGVAVDATGNLFIADFYNNVIRKVGTNGIITTVAGRGAAGYSGDGGAATDAELYWPNDVAVDTTGNLFISDEVNDRIRKVGTNGIITTVAGNGTNGFWGDGGMATNAEFYNPISVTVDATGNLFIADYFNDRIRKVGTNGIIITVAGNGYVNPNTGYGGYSGDGGAATNAELSNPWGVAVNATGNLFIADLENSRVRQVDINGIITTVAGNGTNGYSGDGGMATNAEINFPTGAAVDANGNLFIADGGNNRIRKVSILGPTLALNDVVVGNAGAYDLVVSSPYGSVTSSVVNLTVIVPLHITTASLPSATNGVAYSQQLSAVYGQLPYSWSLISGSLPSGLSLAANGLISGTPKTNGLFNFTVKVTDATNGTATQALVLIVFPSISFIQPANNSVAVMVGNNVTFSVSVSGTGPFSYQWQLNGTNLPNGIITTVAGNGTAGHSGDGGAATNAELYYPSGVALDTNGNLFIGDTGNNRIRKVGTNGIISTVAGNGTAGYSGDGATATNAELYYPRAVQSDNFGNLYVADEYNQRIRKTGTNGIITTIAGNGTAGFYGDGGPATNANLNYPRGLAVDVYGNLYIGDTGNNRIRKVGTNGIITTVAGNGTAGYSGDGAAATNAELNFPYFLAVDVLGNIFIADANNNRIREVKTNGIIVTVAGNGVANFYGDGGAATNAELDDPLAVAVDAIGNLFIADNYNDCIREVGTNGIITTVAGGGGNYPGDGGAATSAELYEPVGIAVDATGNLFIADCNNQRIRKVVNPGIPGPTQILQDVGVGNAGAYDVVVSSSYGSVTSSVVNLTVTLLPPVILSAPQITVGKTNFTFLLSGPAGSNYVLQVSTNLLNWSPVSTSTIPVSGTINVTNAITNYNRRFYRVHFQ